jgi:hypothetical protein
VSLRSRLKRLEKQEPPTGVRSAGTGQSPSLGSYEDATEGTPVLEREGGEAGEACAGCGWVPEVLEIVEIVVRDHEEVRRWREMESRLGGPEASGGALR